MNLLHAINGYSIETNKRNTFIGYQRRLTSEGCAAMARQEIRLANTDKYSNWYHQTRAAYWYEQAAIARKAGR